ncbi:hypothetical protein conserved [Leishmania donovani]|uniref:Uncharacterized protein n=3 Tax=Leishmania donovani species complex TaxID=38574 RepID=A4I402_LEIIN|nr:conserved hypothetical protein [Leishmania infantum JPCM5]TPP40364.1 hypothetical protein CGC20_12745 [Leishmania donovani]CAC9505429.1 hypothetical_protein_-_conserved [Leishmania infantum]CAJ1990431.1 hypothetical protein conserved [Leishmania donovani]CAM69509.1 conserved hypothetical protein [Leishmania infantum JPCM5]SUZ43452.1 hypothetical_protein_-_conserved [Leishmania infantum]|eukprot:XP_001470314.1 conserved hypothetical protein [Leishmania infantum JPCM5]
MARRHRPLFHTLLASVVVLLVVHGGAPAAGLSGSAPCPATAEAAPEWCNKLFGGAGGIVTAGAWSESFFACVCNGAAPLIISRHQDLPEESEQQSSPALLEWDSSRALSTQLSSSMAVFSSSSSSAPAKYTCRWIGFFSPYPDGEQCLPSTGVCPTNCTVMPPFLCDSQQAGSCTVSESGTLLYTCLTCTGRLFTINTTGPDTCHRTYTEALCDPRTECSGHGCCAMQNIDPSSSSATGGVCNCFANRTHGYYAGENCAACASGYYVDSEGVCKTRVQPVQILLASIGKTWTMVSPNVSVLFLFVIFSMVRKLNASDRPFELTGLRRANLSSVQVARRRQQSLFHSKYIPMRPAKSRSFTNPHQPRTRGPSAY